MLSNPDNFLVSAGFEDVFEEMTASTDTSKNQVSIKYSGFIIVAPVLSIKVTDRTMKLKLMISGSDMSRWINSHKVINSHCEVSSGDYFCSGFVASISCSPGTSEYHTVKYTILIDKNT